MQNFIGGRWIEGAGSTRKIIDPSNEQILEEFREASQEQTQEAIQAARTAFDHGEWAQDRSLRVRALHELADRLEAASEEFARLETLNTGKPIRESRLDISDSVACLRYYAELAKESQPQVIAREEETESLIIEEPIGVCGLIVPWNFPLLLGLWKLAPALAAGNTVIFKPSELTPLTIVKLMELVEQCPFPSGVVNLVLGAGDPVGATIVNSPEVDKISFTGGTVTGRSIYEACAAQIKRVSLELGGKSPLIVLNDADLALAVEWAVFGSFFNQGQVCVASSRLLVHQDLADPFLQRLSEKLQQIRFGPPLAEETEIGPLISAAHRDRVKSYIQAGLKEGATLLCGGEPVGEQGYYLSPAVFVDVHQEMRIVQEEIFGPVITVQTFETDEEAVALANGTPYGLAAGVLAGDVERARRIAARLKAGTIWINSYHTPFVDAPWGGFKQSGIGRELGPHGMNGFTETKHLHVTPTLVRLDWYGF
ncbi:aldehyde dehydrogenase family protein [Brevibacillus humidisoli]|uniref:aldehyde dehydrogenase family protein n=1 Tax=Brevibacillus humidisoli TaxID=2895522 RepID=UPI001E3B510E|nr:aldehyde dehydrogenase family protein [Brevibacillus humidisoli]UFJ39900.1 aldehyde dehydrogenase family protein [Brevibacillus humidisoli]